jgi:hypothetical protein
VWLLDYGGDHLSWLILPRHRNWQLLDLALALDRVFTASESKLFLGRQLTDATEGHGLGGLETAFNGLWLLQSIAVGIRQSLSLEAEIVLSVPALRRRLRYLGLVWLHLFWGLVHEFVGELLLLLHLLHDLAVQRAPLIGLLGLQRLLLGDKVVLSDHDGPSACRIGWLWLAVLLWLVSTSVGLRILFEFKQGILIRNVRPFLRELIVLRGCRHLLLPDLERRLGGIVVGTIHEGPWSRALSLNELSIQIGVWARSLIDLSSIVRSKLPLLLTVSLARLLLLIPQRPQVLPGVPVVHL